MFYLSFLSNAINAKDNLIFSVDWSYNNINLETIPFPDSSGTYHYLGDLKKIRLINTPRDLFEKDSTKYTHKTIALLFFHCDGIKYKLHFFDYFCDTRKTLKYYPHSIRWRSRTPEGPRARQRPSWSETQVNSG